MHRPRHLTVLALLPSAFVLGLVVVLVAGSARVAGGGHRAPGPPYNTTPSGCWPTHTHPRCGPWVTPADPVARSTPFAYAGCVYWAYEKRPDIYNNSRDHTMQHWAAYQWPDRAREEGLAVDHTPRAGDVLIFPRNVLGAGPVGHAAYVEQVNPDGSFVMSDYNGAFAGRGGTYLVLPETSAQESSRLWYIHLPSRRPPPTADRPRSTESPPLAGSPVLRVGQSQARRLC